MSGKAKLVKEHSIKLQANVNTEKPRNKKVQFGTVLECIFEENTLANRKLESLRTVHSFQPTTYKGYKNTYIRNKILKHA